jgi:CRISPR/Cas system-associated protein Cas10 (large subunit of type III CRISPR-Cas system)
MCDILRISQTVCRSSKLFSFFWLYQLLQSNQVYVQDNRVIPAYNIPHAVRFNILNLIQMIVWCLPTQECKSNKDRCKEAKIFWFGTKVDSDIPTNVTSLSQCATEKSI